MNYLLVRDLNGNFHSEKTAVKFNSTGKILSHYISIKISRRIWFWCETQNECRYTNDSIVFQYRDFNKGFFLLSTEFICMWIVLNGNWVLNLRYWIYNVCNFYKCEWNCKFCCIGRILTSMMWNEIKVKLMMLKYLKCESSRTSWNLVVLLK
jgi:hypothetical protein